MSGRDKTPIRPLSELRDTGLLWLINRQVFHPRGYALALAFDDETGEITGFQILGDGHEPWNFQDGEENGYLSAVNATLPPAHHQRPTWPRPRL